LRSRAVGKNSWPVRVVLERYPSVATQKNVRSLTMGPPKLPPYSRKYRSVGFGIPARSAKNSLACALTGRVWKSAEPWIVFVPDRPVALNTPPPVRPISASYVCTWTFTSASASIVGIAEGAPTRFVIGTPSSRKLLARVWAPPTEMNDVEF